MNPISILILADQALVRDGLTALLQFEANLSVIAGTATVHGALEWIGRRTPDAVLIDLTMPICTIDAARRILELAPSAHVIALSEHADNPAVASLITAQLRQVGASALISKSTSASELIRVIQLVMSGAPIFPPQVSVQPDLPEAIAQKPVAFEPSLTIRQTQVLKFVAQGLATKEIADRLRISPKTVEKHRQSVKEKLRTHNAADLARRAIHLGLVDAA